MQFILGLLCGAVLFALLYGAYLLGKRGRPAPVHREVDDEQRKRAERLHAGFQELMSYDVTTALKGKG